MSIISYTHFPGVEDTETGRASVYVLNFPSKVDSSSTKVVYEHFGDCILWGDIVVLEEKGVPKKWYLVNYDRKKANPYSFTDVTEEEVPLSFMKMKDELNKNLWDLPEAPQHVREFIKNKGLF